MTQVRCYLNGKLTDNPDVDAAVVAAHEAGSAWCIEVFDGESYSRFGNDIRLIRHPADRPVGPDLLALVGREFGRRYDE